jgi:hypothetical protein
MVDGGTYRIIFLAGLSTICKLKDSAAMFCFLPDTEERTGRSVTSGAGHDLDRRCTALEAVEHDVVLLLQTRGILVYIRMHPLRNLLAQLFRAR